MKWVKDGNTTFNIIVPYTYRTDNINKEFYNVDLIMEFNKKLTDINNFSKNTYNKEKKLIK